MSEFTKTLIVDCGGGQGSDYTTIKEAADDLGANGGTIIVESGEYELDGNGDQTTIDVCSDTTIIARGKVIISVTGNIPVFRNDDQTNGNERITISGFIIQLDTSSSYTCDALYMKKVSYSVFENLKIFKNGTGSPANDTAAILIDGGVQVEAYSNSFGNIVSQCELANFGYGVCLKDFTKENMIVNTSIHDCLSKGMYLDNAPRNILSENTVYANANGGIDIFQSDYTAVQDNQVYENKAWGIRVKESSNCSLQGNICRENDCEGIVVEGSDTTGANYHVLSGNVCMGNGTTGAYSGIYLNSYVKYVTVNGNNCYDNSKYGIQELNDASTCNNLFVGNMCHGNTNGQLVAFSSSDVIAVNASE